MSVKSADWYLLRRLGIKGEKGHHRKNITVHSISKATVTHIAQSKLGENRNIVQASKQRIRQAIDVLTRTQSWLSM